MDEIEGKGPMQSPDRSTGSGEERRGEYRGPVRPGRRDAMHVAIRGRLVLREPTPYVARDHMDIMAVADLGRADRGDVLHEPAHKGAVFGGHDLDAHMRDPHSGSPRSIWTFGVRPTRERRSPAQNPATYSRCSMSKMIGSAPRSRTLRSVHAGRTEERTRTTKYADKNKRAVQGRTTRRAASAAAAAGMRRGGPISRLWPRP